MMMILADCPPFAETRVLYEFPLISVPVSRKSSQLAKCRTTDGQGSHTMKVNRQGVRFLLNLVNFRKSATTSNLA